MHLPSTDFTGIFTYKMNLTSFYNSATLTLMEDIMGIGAGEIITLLIVLAICIKPEDLPRLVRRLAKLIGATQHHVDAFGNWGQSNDVHKSDDKNKTDSDDPADNKPPNSME